MTKDEELKKLRTQVKYLKADLEFYKNEKANYENLYLKSRRWITDKFNWFVDLSAKDSSPDMKWLIKNTKDVLVETKN